MNSMAEQTLPAPRREFPFPALALFFFLTSIYLLTYNGLFRSIAELTMFSLMESMVQDLSLATPQLIFSPLHNPIAPFEFLQPLLSIPYYLAAQTLPGLGNIQTVMLFNILVAAATALILWFIISEMGYSSGWALGVGLIFGLATMAWPYSRTYLREPLVGFFYTLGFFALVRYRWNGQLLWAVLCLAAVTFSLTVKLTSLIALPVFGLALYFVSPPSLRRRLLARGVVVIPVGALLFLLVMWQRWGTDWPVYLFRPIARGGSILDSLVRIWGLTSSPGKGLFLYSPILLLALWGGVKLWREQKIEIITIFGTLLLYLLAYSRRPGWYGGLDWGPRYLVPLLPLLVIPTVEIFRIKDWRQWLTGGLLAVSLAIQLVASTANYGIYYGELASIYPKPEQNVLLDPLNLGLSPVVGQFQFWNPQNFDLLWWRAAGPEETPVLDLPLLLLLLFLIFLSGGFLIYANQKGELSVNQPWLAAVVLGFSFGIVIFFLRANQVEASYWHIDAYGLREVAQEINQEPGKRLVVSVSNNFHHLWLKNFLKGDFTHYWFSPLQEQEVEALLEPMADASRITLITDSIPPNSGSSYVERWLNDNAFRYDARWVGPYVLFRFAVPRDLNIARPVDYTFGESISLTHFSQEGEVVQRGEPLRLEFGFQKVGEIANNYTLFVHLLTQEGEFVAGVDGEPKFGAAPTSAWREGELLSDRRAIFVPQDIAPGEYLVEVGFYIGGNRLPARGPNGDLGDRVIIGEVRVR